VPISARLRRMRRNVEHLVLRNYPNPEEDFRSNPRRAFLQRTFQRATLWLLPFAVIGLWLTRRRPLGVLPIANLTTAIVTAAFFYAEARYRVPYGPFLIVAGVTGAAFLLGRAQGLLRNTRSPRARVVSS